MKKSPLSPRSPRFNRFQTAISGLLCVRTAVDAHFDPATEPPRRPALSKAEMEQVAKTVVGDDARG